MMASCIEMPSNFRSSPESAAPVHEKISDEGFQSTAENGRFDV
jgi:hypothetical protein